MGKYGDWTVLSGLPREVDSGGGYRYKLLVKCICGAIKRIDSYALEKGLSKRCRSCSCKGVQVKHGLSYGCKEYRAWTNMKTRCYNVKIKAYKNYGGRGIKVCKRWKDSFENFYKDMGKRPKGLTLDRINNNGDYKPINCRWATRQQQNKNRRKFKRRRV